MHLGLILNRVFRTKDNPLFQYIVKHQNEINKLYFILPLEDLTDASEVKRDYYYKVVKGFVNALDIDASYRLAKKMEGPKTNPVLGYRTAGSAARSALEIR